MVFVPGGDYQLQGWDIPYDRSVRLADFFIDKFEVSNRQFKESSIPVVISTRSTGSTRSFETAKL
jgi:hypothetical protein